MKIGEWNIACKFRGWNAWFLGFWFDDGCVNIWIGPLCIEFFCDDYMPF